MGGRIRVLHIITRLDPGGSTTNTLETVARLDRSRYAVDLIAGRTAGVTEEVRNFFEHRAVVCVFVDELVREPRFWLDVRAFFKLWWLIRKGRYAIVHTHCSKAGILGRWAAFFAGVKIIVHTPHGHIFYGYFSPFVTGVFLWMERLTALVTTKLVALTENGIREHINLHVGRREQWTAIPSGIDLEAFREDMAMREQTRLEYGINDGAVLFVTVTRLEPVKANAILIQALAGLGQGKLMIVGEGSERKKLEALVAQLGLAGRVNFLGYQASVVRFLNAADSFVLGSLNEGMGRCVLEAMACAKPVIVSRVGGVSELLEDGVEGIIVPPGDVAALSRAMSRIAGDASLRARMAVCARARASGDFSIASMVVRIDNIYFSKGRDVK